MSERNHDRAKRASAARPVGDEVERELVLPKDAIIDQICEIEYEIGGQRFERLGLHDIKFNMQLLGKQITIVEDKIHMPLPFFLDMFPVHSHRWHSLRIRIDFVEPFQWLDDVRLIGTVYNITNEECLNKLYQTPLELFTCQTQFTGPEECQQGINKIQLNYNHPVCCLYINGLNKTKVRSLQLVFNDEEIIKGDIDFFEQRKREAGFATDNVVLFFEEPSKFNVTNMLVNKHVNFSQINHAKLVIDAEEPMTVNISAINLAIFRYSSGMVGSAFSK